MLIWNKISACVMVCFMLACGNWKKDNYLTSYSALFNLPQQKIYYHTKDKIRMWRCVDAGICNLDFVEHFALHT